MIFVIIIIFTCMRYSSSHAYTLSCPSKEEALALQGTIGFSFHFISLYLFPVMKCLWYLIRMVSPNNCIVLYCFDGVVVPAQFTETFLRYIVFPEFRYWNEMKWNEMKWNEKPIVPWRAKTSSFEGQLNVYACDELFRMVVQWVALCSVLMHDTPHWFATCPCCTSLVAGWCWWSLALVLLVSPRCRYLLRFPS